MIRIKGQANIDFPCIDYSPAGNNRAGREKRCLEQPLGFVTDIYIYIYANVRCVYPSWFVNQAANGGKRNREMVTIVLSISYLIILSRLLVKFTE